MVVNYRKIDAPVFYLLTVISSDPEIGSAQGGGMYKEGHLVTVTAQASEGEAVFSGWRDAAGQIVSTEASYTFQITADVSLTAVFTRLYSVNCLVMPSGTGSFTGAGKYQSGASVTVTAVPDDGYIFSGWLDAAGDLLSSDPVYTFTVTQDITLTARFAAKCVVTILLGLEGAGSPTGAGVYPQGATVTVNAGTNEGYSFTGWKDSSGAIVSTAESYSFAVTGDITLTAEYVQVFSVIIITNIAGAGVPSGMGEYEAGSTVIINANTAEGYTFTGWQDSEGNTLSTSAEYTFTINSNVTLLAVYEEVASRLPAGYTELEYIQSSGTQYFDSGVKPTSTIKISMTVEPLVAGTSSQKNFFGSTKTTSPAYYFIAGWNNSGVRVTTGSLPSSGVASYKKLSSDTSLRKITIVIDCKSKEAFVEGETKVALTNVNANTSMSTIKLLAGATGTSQLAANLYSCQIFLDSVLTRDFVPCKNPSGIVGLYDMVTAAFYANKGTGAFIAGPAI